MGAVHRARDRTTQLDLELPAPQSAQLLLYPGNPFAGLADPVATGAKAGSIASQVASNTAALAISTAPTAKAAGTYTVQFFNGGSSIAASTGTVNYVNDVGSPCGASPLVGHIIN